MIPRILWLVYGYLLVFLTGGALLMTLFVAPSLFAHLGVRKAGEAVSVLFPGYFHLLFTGAIIEVSLLLLLSRISSRKTKILLWGWTGGLVLSGALALYLGPHALELKRLHDQMPADMARSEAFALAHRITFLLNLSLLLGLLAATLSLLSGTVNPPPGTTLPVPQPKNPA
ncbi:MAG: putative membrane protein [Leptospirillum sp. Group IV 'UBA BS']|nr:MAG: putative membrane protein [Leptospirillum sp. Group IV 'UBA BS']MCL5285351.1 DUF4149 domain-containing protein [Nitrospirota bacterium]